MEVSWKQSLADPKHRRALAKDASHVLIFLLGVGAEVVAIATHDLGLAAAGTTLFGLVGIARA
jgi:hypothetical protein